MNSGEECRMSDSRLDKTTCFKGVSSSVLALMWLQECGVRRAAGTQTSWIGAWRGSDLFSHPWGILSLQVFMTVAQ